MEIASFQTYLTHSNEYQTLLNQIQTNREAILLSEKCVLPTVLVNQTIFNEVPAMNLPLSLQNATFNCDALSTCSIACSTPNPVLLQE